MIARYTDKIGRRTDKIERRSNIGNGLKLTGTANQTATSNVSYPFDRTKYYTVECLFKFNGTGSNGDSSGARIFYSCNPSNRALGFFINNSGRIRSYLSNSPYSMFSNRTFSFGDWVHYVGTYAPSGASTTEHIMYLNAVLDNQINASSPSTAVGGDLALGSAADSRTPNITYYRFRLYESNTTVANQADVNQMMLGEYPSSINSDLVIDFDFNQIKGTRHYSKRGSVYVDLTGLPSGSTNYGGGAWVDEQNNIAK